MRRETAFVALGSTAPDAGARFTRALAALSSEHLDVAAVGRIVTGPFLDAGGQVQTDAPPVANTVAQVATTEDPHVLMQRLLAIEAAEGRVRDGSAARALDLDLLAFGAHEVQTGGLTLPHPRLGERAFVLGPWEELAPAWRVGASGPTVMALAADLRARAPEAFRALRSAAPPALPALDGACERLEDLGSLRAWRGRCSGTVALVPTMGALHAGHLSLVRHGRSRCDHVVATIFVNPLQFAPGEDLARYPRTLDADLAALRQAGADAVYLPAPGDLYPPDFSTYVVPGGPAEGFEGARRPDHFRGVATIVTKLLLRAQPTHSFFGRKDAQQVAVLTRMARDLDLPVQVVVCPTVRAADGLALSSRNRYLDADQRVRALLLDRALSEMQFALGTAGPSGAALRAVGQATLEAGDVEVEYLDVVDPLSMEPQALLRAPALAVAVIRVGETRLLDNRWMVPAGADA